MRIGIGYDIHKLVEGRKLILGGISIPNKKGLLGHTDADVLTHAIIDALLGAAGLGDIGQHFPDTDSRWKDANSIDLLEITLNSLKTKGYKVTNVDTVIITEEPKLSPFTSSMKIHLAKVLGIKEEQISIKPKTNEGQDSIGQKNSICAWASVLLD